MMDAQNLLKLARRPAFLDFKAVADIQIAFPIIIHDLKPKEVEEANFVNQNL